jgi:hypothetical protein
MENLPPGKNIGTPTLSGQAGRHKLISVLMFYDARLGLFTRSMPAPARPVGHQHGGLANDRFSANDVRSGGRFA